jgi:hypothetical protein
MGTWRKLRFAGFACCALLAVGCASVGGPAVSPEEQVKLRAQERWDLLLAGKLEAAYGYLSPAQRSAISLIEYQRQVLSGKVRWRAANVEKVECEGLVCAVDVNLDIRVMAAVPGVSSFDLGRPIQEKWVRVDNQWWFIPE